MTQRPRSAVRPAAPHVRRGPARFEWTSIGAATTQSARQRVDRVSRRRRVDAVRQRLRGTEIFPDELGGIPGREARCRAPGVYARGPRWHSSCLCTRRYPCASPGSASSFLAAGAVRSSRAPARAPNPHRQRRPPPRPRRGRCPWPTRSPMPGRTSPRSALALSRVTERIAEAKVPSGQWLPTIARDRAALRDDRQQHDGATTCRRRSWTCLASAAPRRRRRPPQTSLPMPPGSSAPASPRSSSTSAASAPSARRPTSW